MKERNSASRASGINVGSASIIMVFAVLALTVFAVLSLVTAKNELKLTEKSVQAAANYYAADAKAAREANEYIAAGFLPDGAASYSYSVPIDDKQQLCVTLTDTGSIAVHEWRIAPAGEWTPDESLNVFSGSLIDIPDF